MSKRLRKKYKFYIVSHGGLRDPFRKCVSEGMEVAEKLLNLEANVRAIYLGPEGTDKYSIEELEHKIKQAAADKPDGMAVVVTDYKRIDKLLREIIEDEKIPVIAINVPDFRNKAKRIPYLFYIGMDEFVCGKRLAERVLSEFRPKRAVFGIHQKGHKGLERRADGIRTVLEREGNIPIDAIEIGEDPEVAASDFVKYWKDHQDTDVIFVPGPVGTQAALKFIDENQLTNKIKIAVIRLPKKTDVRISNAIRQDKIICASEQGPFFQGFLPVYWLYQYCINNGNIPKNDIMLGPTIVDKYNIDYVENVEEVIIQKWIELLEEKGMKGLKNRLENLFQRYQEHKALIVAVVSIVVGLIGIVVTIISILVWYSSS